MNQPLKIYASATDKEIDAAIDSAVFSSVAFDRIEHVHVAAVAWDAAVDSISAQGDDTAETTDDDGVVMVEAWGENDDGAGWRVHLHRVERA